MFIKSQLISEVSKKLHHLPEKDLSMAINHIIHQMSETLAQSGRIEIRGFGSFSLHYRAPRKAHNPRTGEKIMTEPKYAVHFKPGKELRHRINANRHIPLKDTWDQEDGENE